MLIIACNRHIDTLRPSSLIIKQQKKKHCEKTLKIPFRLRQNRNTEAETYKKPTRNHPNMQNRSFYSHLDSYIIFLSLETKKDKIKIKNLNLFVPRATAEALNWLLIVAARFGSRKKEQQRSSDDRSIYHQNIYGRERKRALSILIFYIPQSQLLVRHSMDVFFSSYPHICSALSLSKFLALLRSRFIFYSSFGRMMAWLTSL